MVAHRVGDRTEGHIHASLVDHNVIVHQGVAEVHAVELTRHLAVHPLSGLFIHTEFAVAVELGTALAAAAAVFGRALSVRVTLRGLLAGGVALLLYAGPGGHSGLWWGWGAVGVFVGLLN